MYLNFKKIDSTKRETPMLRLRTLAGKELGPVPFVYGLNFEVNYSDLSTIEFSTPYMVNGMLNPLYAALTGYKVIYTDELGVYMITNPEKSGDGVSEVKQVKGYSLEYAFQKKSLYLEEGTYCFWNPLFPDDTILGRIVELDQSWSVGYVAPRLLNCYRTFDEYDDNALNFLYGDAMESYRCAIVFDVYNKTINAYDAGDDTASLPIYLNYENLVNDIKVTEDNENIATKLHLYGGDDLTIRDVNPIGGDYLVDLSFFLNNGDLDIVASDSTEVLSDKVRAWRADVLSQQPYYTGLVALRSSATSEKLILESQLTELNGDLQTLTAQQNVYIQEYALEKTEAGQASKQKQLDTIYQQIVAKEAEIAAKEADIEDAKANIDEYLEKIQSVTNTLSIDGYFTEGERLILTQYLIEGEMTEDTFVSTDIGSSDTAISTTLTGTVSVTDSDISRVSLTEFSRTMYTLSGGTLSIPNSSLSAQIVRGTLDRKDDGTYVFTAYLGTVQYSGQDFSYGMVTLTGTLSSLSSDIATVTENSIKQYKGTKLSFKTTSAGMYFTIAANDYQQYAVEMELYEFGSDALSDLAWPTYEFDINTANFLYQEKFEPFKNKLELGKSVHLQLGSEGLIMPKIIGVELDYDDITNFNLIFSNRYQRKDALEYLSDEVSSAAKSSSRFDASKYLYDRTADKMTDVTAYMNNMLDAAVQTIKAAANQSVIIDGAGIHVSSTDDTIQLRIVNGMIAMSDDGFQTAKLAIGRFYSKEHGMDLWGVNAELVAGTLLLGSSLYIQTQGGYFTVDDNGVYIDSLKFYINNGKNLSETLSDIDTSIGSVDDDVAAVAATVNAVTTTTSAGDVYLNANDLSGLISATQAQMQSAGGNVLFDSDGIWLMNASTKASATKAVWMNENGILFGSGSKSSNPATSSSWTWTTAIDHDGVVAESISAGTLSGMTISGGEITIGKSSSSDTTYLYVDSSGDLGIGANSSATKGFNFYVDYNGNLYSGYNSSTGDYNFKVSKSGAITANSINVTNGTFAGTLSAATGTLNNITATNGTFTNGTFSGTLTAAQINGTLTAGTNGWVVGCGLAIGNVTYNSSGIPSSANFYVNSNGNVVIKSGSISWGAVTGTDAIEQEISDAQSAADKAQSTADSALDAIDDLDIPVLPSYIKSTYIAQTEIRSPTITAGTYYGDAFRVIAESKNAGFYLKGTYGSQAYDMFAITYYDGSAPTVTLSSPCSASIYISGVVYCTGSWDFGAASVTGLTATFG